MKAIERFITSAEDEMIRTIEWTKTAEDITDRCEFATRAIENSFEQAFGALLYVRIYDRSMTESEYKALRDRLQASKFKALEIAWNIF